MDPYAHDMDSYPHRISIAYSISYSNYCFDAYHHAYPDFYANCAHIHSDPYANRGPHIHAHPYANKYTHCGYFHADANADTHSHKHTGPYAYTYANGHADAFRRLMVACERQAKPQSPHVPRLSTAGSGKRLWYNARLGVVQKQQGKIETICHVLLTIGR